MKPTTFSTGRFWLALFLIGITVGLVSWDRKQDQSPYKQSITDTVPKTKTDRDKKIRDLDDAIDELNALDLKETLEKARKEMAEAMKQFDGDKIRLQIEQSMKAVDMEKIMKEVKESMSKIDMEKIKAEISEAMKNVDMAKIQVEINEAMGKVDMDKIKAELEKIKGIDMKEISREVEEEMKKVREEMKELGPKIEKELEQAKGEIEKARVELKEYKTFVDGLDKDGLINKKEGYNLKHKDGELFINGKKVSEQVYNKYRPFLEKHKEFKINKTDDDFDIDMD